MVCSVQTHCTSGRCRLFAPWPQAHPSSIAAESDPAWVKSDRLSATLSDPRHVRAGRGAESERKAVYLGKRFRLMTPQDHHMFPAGSRRRAGVTPPCAAPRVGARSTGGSRTRYRRWSACTPCPGSAAGDQESIGRGQSSARNTASVPPSMVITDPQKKPASAERR